MHLYIEPFNELLEIVNLRPETRILRELFTHRCNQIWDHRVNVTKCGLEGSLATFTYQNNETIRTQLGQRKSPFIRQKLVCPIDVLLLWLE